MAQDDNYERRLLRVRIHLNLARAAEAENTIKVKNPKTGRWPTIAYGRALILNDVRPIVHETTRARIASGQQIRKTPHAFLEGDLVAWNGRLRAANDYDDLKSEIMKQHQELEDDSFRRALVQAFSAQTLIGFNPKMAKLFYVLGDRGRKPKFAFQGAGRLGVCGWSYAAIKPETIGLKRTDFVRLPPPSSAVEKREIPKGIQRTIQRKEKLGLS